MTWVIQIFRTEGGHFQGGWYIAADAKHPGWPTDNFELAAKFATREEADQRLIGEIMGGVLEYRLGKVVSENPLAIETEWFSGTLETAL